MPDQSRGEGWIIYASYEGERKWHTAQKALLDRAQLVAVLSNPEKLRVEVLDPLQLGHPPVGVRVLVVVVYARGLWNRDCHYCVEDIFFKQAGVGVYDAVRLDGEIFPLLRSQPRAPRHLSVYGCGFRVNFEHMNTLVDVVHRVSSNVFSRDSPNAQ